MAIRSAAPLEFNQLSSHQSERSHRDRGRHHSGTQEEGLPCPVENMFTHMSQVLNLQGVITKPEQLKDTLQAEMKTLERSFEDYRVMGAGLVGRTTMANCRTVRVEAGIKHQLIWKPLLADQDVLSEEVAKSLMSNWMYPRLERAAVIRIKPKSGELAFITIVDSSRTMANNTDYRVFTVKDLRIPSGLVKMRATRFQQNTRDDRAQPSM